MSLICMSSENNSDIIALYLIVCTGYFRAADDTATNDGPTDAAIVDHRADAFIRYHGLPLRGAKIHGTNG
jgi:hypothetical protein